MKDFPFGNGNDSRIKTIMEIVQALGLVRPGISLKIMLIEEAPDKQSDRDSMPPRTGRIPMVMVIADRTSGPYDLAELLEAGEILGTGNPFNEETAQAMDQFFGLDDSFDPFAFNTPPMTGCGGHKRDSFGLMGFGYPSDIEKIFGSNFGRRPTGFRFPEEMDQPSRKKPDISSLIKKFCLCPNCRVDKLAKESGEYHLVGKWSAFLYHLQEKGLLRKRSTGKMDFPDPEQAIAEGRKFGLDPRLMEILEDAVSEEKTREKNRESVYNILNAAATSILFHEPGKKQTDPTSTAGETAIEEELGEQAPASATAENKTDPSTTT